MKKRSIAFFTSLVLIFSMLPMPFASAVEGLKPSTTKMKFVMEYMNYTNAAKTEFTEDPDDEGYTSIDEVGNIGDFRTSGIVETVTKPNRENISVNDEFLVGIKLVDMDNVVEAASGLNNLCLTLLYDKDYIEPLDRLYYLYKHIYF